MKKRYLILAVMAFLLVFPMVGLAKKASGPFLIEAITYKEHKDPSCTRLEIEIIHRDTGELVRPFRVDVKDTKGRSLVEPFQVNNKEESASFSSPTVGLYKFMLNWADRKDMITVEFE